MGRSPLNEAESQRLPIGFTASATSTFNWFVEDLSFHCLTINNFTFPIRFDMSSK